MAEYIPAMILVGGELASDRLTDLLDAVTEDGVTNADDGGIADEGDLRRSSTAPNRCCSCTPTRLGASCPRSKRRASGLA